MAIAIMAAGKGTRLKSKHPKVLHEVGGKPLLAHVIAAATKVVSAQDIYAIIGHEAERVRQAVAHTGINFVLQAPQRGTGHALMVARDALAHYDQVIVLSGDAPLITPETITKLRDFHCSKKAAMTILTSALPDPTGYGRVIRRSPKGDDVQAIVEQKSATPKQQKVREINSGFYAFALAKCQQFMTEGVTIFSPQTCVIDSDVQIGADTTVEPFVQILGTTRIGSDCRIRSYSVIRDCEIADGVLIRPACVLEGATVEAGAVIGPYSHLRAESYIGEGAHVGNFVETKKIRLGKGSKANHLTYLGDAEIGDGVNIGAGTITCNYDGVHKHKTVIEDGVFIGSDSTLVAPVRVRKGAYVAAASCVTEDVPEESLALGRARQINKEGWARKRREGDLKSSIRGKRS